MSNSNIENARSPEQVERMRALRESGKCFFCDRNYESVGASVAICSSKYWYIKRNDYPYEGVVYQYLIVPHKHVKNLRELMPRSQVDLFKMIAWLEDYLQLEGGSLFIRFGKFELTGATFEHLHFQLLVGGTKPHNWTSKDSIPITLGYKQK